MLYRFPLCMRSDATVDAVSPLLNQRIGAIDKTFHAAIFSATMLSISSMSLLYHPLTIRVQVRCTFVAFALTCWMLPTLNAGAAGGLEQDCLHGSPAGIALSGHLAKAKSGDVDSMFCAGAIHLYVRHDAKKALPWLEQSANAGDKRSPLILGILYEKGTGVKEDPSIAAHWYQKGMDNGNPAATRRLAEMYRLGLGVPHDEAKARELLSTAVALGDKAAPMVAEKQAKDRAQAKSGQSIKEEAYRVYRKKEYEQSAKLYRQCADMGHDACQLALGVQYEYGLGVKKDDGQAVAWYRKAADQGNAISQKALGLMYELGKGVRENWPEAFRLYSLSATTYSEGAFQVARMFEFGMGVPQNRAQAIKWFKKAAELGHPKGAYWARWLNDYSNCIGFRNEQEQKTLGSLRCPADPVGVVFHRNSERLAYMREKAIEFDKWEKEVLASQARRGAARDEAACNSAGGVWMLKGSSQGAYCQ